MDKLLLLNPKFDGKQTHKIENGNVTELTFSTAEVSDISPLKALPHLQSLTIGGTARKRARQRSLTAGRNAADDPLVRQDESDRPLATEWNAAA